MKDCITVELFNVPFTKNDPHRFTNAQLNAYVSSGSNRLRMYDCRMFKNSQIKINIKNVDYDRLTEFGYGRWYIQNNDASRTPKNTVFGQAYYHYFFITGFNFINNSTATISIQEDSFSTYWRDDMKLNGFVKRRHVTDSEDNSHYYDLPEPTSTTDAIYWDKTYFNVFGGAEVKYCFILSNVLVKAVYSDGIIKNWIKSKIPDIFDPITEGSYYSGIANAGVSYVFDDINDIIKLISSLNTIGYTNAVGQIFMSPKYLHQIESKHFSNEIRSEFWDLLTGDRDFDQEILSNTDSLVLKDTLTISKLTSAGNGAYTPKYKKCFSEQYYSVVISNGSEFREFNPSLLAEKDGSYEFDIYVDNGPETLMFCVPKYYAGKNGTPFEESLMIKYSQPCSVCNDMTGAQLIKLQDAIVSKVVDIGIEGAEAIKYSTIGKAAFNTENPLIRIPKASELQQAIMKNVANYVFRAQSGKVNNNDEMSNAGFQKELTGEQFDVVREIGNSVKEITEITGNIGRSNTIHGSTGSSASNFACTLPKGKGTANSFSDSFCVYNKHLSVDDTIRVDRFFSRYGYNVSENTNNVPLRDTYTYIEGDLNITNYSTLPVYARADIESLFSSGLTLWNQDMYQYDVN